MEGGELGRIVLRNGLQLSSYCKLVGSTQFYNKGSDIESRGKYPPIKHLSESKLQHVKGSTFLILSQQVFKTMHHLPTQVPH